MVRLEKLKNDEFEWLLATLDDTLPLAKERLTMFDAITDNLKRCGEIGDVAEVAIESDERWIKKRKNILLHSMKDYDDAVVQANERPRSATATRLGKRKNPTVGESNPKKKKPKRLGMRGIRTTPL
jgi:hypothetical protein